MPGAGAIVASKGVGVVGGGAGRPEEDVWGGLILVEGGEGVAPSRSTLRGAAHMIGRSKVCKTVVAHGRVSGQHAAFFRTAGALLLEDRSRFGTYVNGELVGKGGSAPVRDGDRLSLLAPSGSDAIVFRVEVFAMAPASAALCGGTEGGAHCAGAPDSTGIARPVTELGASMSSLSDGSSGPVLPGWPGLHRHCSGSNGKPP